jgi:hypothetical protein
MGSITNLLEDALLDHILENSAYTPGAALYMSLHTVNPGEPGAVDNEVAGNGYARTVIAFSAAATRAVIQDGQVTFPQVISSPWGTVTHFGIHTASSGSGNMIGYGTFDNPIITEVGNVPFVPTLETVISINTGGASDYLALMMLDFAFRDQAFTQPGIFVGLCIATITDSDTGSSITEPAAGNYARIDFPTWNAASGGQADNGADITFATPSDDWATVTFSALCDAATDGNLLIYAAATPNQAPKSGDPVKIPSGDYIVTMD